MWCLGHFYHGFYTPFKGTQTDVHETWSARFRLRSQALKSLNCLLSVSLRYCRTPTLTHLFVDMCSHRRSPLVQYVRARLRLRRLLSVTRMSHNPAPNVNGSMVRASPPGKVPVVAGRVLVH